MADPSNPNSIDLGEILLPTKVVHDQKNAVRINAGALLAQETGATLPRAETPVAAAPVVPKKQNHETPRLETYKGDIEKYVREKNVSVVSAAAAQAQQRTGARSVPVADFGDTGEEKVGHSWIFYTLLIGGGVLALVLGTILVWYVFSRPGKLPVAAAPQAPFISVDGVADIPLASGQGRETTLSNLTQVKNASTLSLGLIEQLRPIAASTTNPSASVLIATQPFIAFLAPSAPANLVRTLGPLFLLGVHTFDTPQPFLILKTDSYEQAFSGMLAWEGSMRRDLLPLFDYTPSRHINGSNASTTPPATLSPGGFTDAIVENHDARVLTNDAGDIYFLWTFLDRTTIVITTNEYTLREVIARLKDAPLAPQVGQ